MADFEISRELVQELAETGAVQAPEGILPGYDYLKELIFKPGKKASTSGPIQYEEFMGTEMVNELGHLIGYANSLLGITYEGLEVSWRRVRVQTIPKKPDNLIFHRDGSGDLSGISILFTYGKEVDEKLLTAGRGSCSNDGDQKVFKYMNGPIVIAQKGWGLPLLQPNQDCGATWHCGMREKNSVVGIVDFLMH